RGNHIDIVQFGSWNREAGPDFSNAAISVNGGQPILGSIEIDLVDRNWELHGHATNPAFEETVLHVFVEKSDREFFTRTRSNRNVPQVRIDPATLPEAFSANIPLARPGRCQAPLRNFPDDRVRSVLDAAAQFRLQKKAARIRAKIDNHGADEALFQEIAAALGYKENKLPFMLIAQRVSLKTLRNNLKDAEAILFGIAGFLETPDLDVYKRSVKNYVRELWDRWWPHRDQLQRLILPKKIWKLSSTRPVNHPQRRLAALASLVHAWPAFRRSLGKVRAGLAVGNAVEKFFESLDHPFWKFHYTLSANPSPEPMALVGKARIADILANVIFPFGMWRLRILRLRSGQVFGPNTRNCRHVWAIADSKPRLRDFSVTIHAGANSPEQSRISRRSCRSTKIFVCRTIPIARIARFQNKWRNGDEKMTKLECRMTKERAFTLIELLVIIAIIAVLLGLALPVFQGVIDRAKKAQAKNDVTQIVTAVNAFYTEYGRYPLDSTVTTDKTYGPADSSSSVLFNELRNVGSVTINTRQIVFISPPEDTSQAS